MSGKNKKKITKTTNIENRKARFDFSIEDSISCGMALKGTEIKSIRSGKTQLKDSFAKIEKGEVWLYNCHIAPYQYGNRFNHNPLRRRKLLLKKGEILKLYSKTKEKNLSLIPLKIYFSRNLAKLELGLAKSKKMYDKRESIRKKELQRTIKKVKNKYTGRR